MVPPNAAVELSALRCRRGPADSQLLDSHRLGPDRDTAIAATELDAGGRSGGDCGRDSAGGVHVLLRPVHTARSGVAPMLVNPMRASVIEPFDRCTAAATPTIAPACATRWNFS